MGLRLRAARAGGSIVVAEDIAAFTERVRSDLSDAAGRVSHLRIDPEIELDGPLDPDGALRRGAARGRVAPGGTDPAGIDAPHRPAPRRSGALRRPPEEVAPVRQQGEIGGHRGGGRGRRPLGEFYRIYRETADRAGFLIRTEQAYRDVWEAYRPGGRVRLLFAQSPDGEPLATLFVPRGPRVVEPCGGMTQEGADTRANYLLKWEAIRTSREQGATSYDLWGLATGGSPTSRPGSGAARCATSGRGTSFSTHSGGGFTRAPAGRACGGRAGARWPAVATPRRSGARRAPSERRATASERPVSAAGRAPATAPREQSRASSPTGTAARCTPPAATSTSPERGPTSARDSGGGRSMSCSMTTTRPWC